MPSEHVLPLACTVTPLKVGQPQKALEVAVTVSDVAPATAFLMLVLSALLMAQLLVLT